MKKEELRKCKWIDQETGRDMVDEVFLFHTWVDINSNRPLALVEYSSSGRVTTFHRFDIKFID